MTGPIPSPDLTSMIREFLADLRERLTSKALEGDTELVVERVFATLSAIAAGVLMALPKTRGKGGLIGALLAIALRFFTKKEAPHAGNE